MPICFWDMESRSAVSLHDAGAYMYAIDPTTQVLCVAYAIDDGETQLWVARDGTPLPAVFLDIAANPSDWQLVAHNYDFERNMLDHVLIPQHGFRPIPDATHYCSQRLALANGYPAELGLLAEALGLPYRKDPAAKRAMLSVSRPKAQRKRNPGTVPVWDEDPAKLALNYARCKSDVETTRAVWRSPKLRPLLAQERAYQLLDMGINGRGIRCDRAFATAARDLAVNERIAINLKLQELTAGAITSVDQTARFLSAINARGHGMTTLNKRSVAQVLAGKPDDYVRQLLELRRTGARAAVNKFKRMLAYASPLDDRLRGTLRMYGAGPGRWAGLGPQLQNLKKNESGLPLSVVDSIRAGDRADIARFGNPLGLLGDVSRAALCAAPGMELKSGDFSAIESVVLAWLAGETWKLIAYRDFQATGDKSIEPYRVIARRMLNKPADAEISQAERQLGKAGDLSGGFGGSVGAWRRIVGQDPRTDAEIKAIIQQWRAAHPATRKFWHDLARAIRVTIRSGQPIIVAPAPQPPIIAAFTNGNLTLTLPSGRAITYPDARLVPSKFEDAPSDVEFKDNARGQWKPYRGWFGTFVENVVQGCARDLLAAAIERFETRGMDVVFHCHDEVTVEIPIGSCPDETFLGILLTHPAWATGLPLGGKVHSGAHYLEPPEKVAEPLAVMDSDEEVLDAAVDSFIAETRDALDPVDDPAAAEREDDADFVADLEADVAPLTDLVSLPLTDDHKVCCPFHADTSPSCAIYADHYYCFGCNARGGRLDWLTQVEGLTAAEAVSVMKDWTAAPSAPAVAIATSDKAELIKTIWEGATPLRGSIAEQYLDQTRHIDTTRLPEDVHRCLRFHPNCVFGPGQRLPCLITLMVDPLSDEPVGIQRTALEHLNGRIEKIDRRTLGHAGVVKLWPAGPRLVVGEGLETVLAAATRLPYAGEPLTPAWAALSTNLLGNLPVVSGAERLIILVDNDSPGIAAAKKCALRWTTAGHTVTELKPDDEGVDFNDLIRMLDGAAS